MERLRRRLPIALLSGGLLALVFLIGVQIVDESSGWQMALVGVAAWVAFMTPDTVAWLRARRRRLSPPA